MGEMLSKASILDMAKRQVDKKLKVLADEATKQKMEPERLPDGLYPSLRETLSDQSFVRAVSIGMLIAAGELGPAVQLPSGREWKLLVLEEGEKNNG